MNEPIQWVYQAGTGCSYCKDGLCERMNELIESGLSMRAASREMEKECEGRWKAASILTLFYYWTSAKNASAHRTYGTGQNEWFTPDKYIQAARTVMGEIDLDPATSASAQKRIQAKHFFTPKENGLAKKWIGRIWLNPPYSQPDIANFVEKMCAEYETGSVKEAIMLTHAYTDTTWFHQAEGKAKLLCFTRGRIGFEEDDGHIAAPTQGQCFFYFGESGKRFNEVFGEFGFIR